MLWKHGSPGSIPEGGENLATTDSLNIVISAETGNAAQNISNTANELTKLDETAKTTDTDMSALVRAMSDAAQNMVAISGNIAASASGMAGFQNSFDNLSAVLQNVSVNFESLNASIQGTSFGDAAAKVTEISDASRASADALRGITDAADGFGSRMNELKDATGGTADGMSRLQSEMSEALSVMRNYFESMSAASSDAEDAAKKIEELINDLDKLKRSSEVGKGNVLSLAAGFKTLKGVVATLGIGAFIKDSNDAYNVQMQNELKLTSHMKHRMNATEDQIQAVKDLASTQQKLGIIGDEIQLAGAQQLTTYARQASTLQTLIPAMNNLIAQNAGYKASVSDATSAADMLGRALDGQYSSLKRMGVYFTTAQENVLKYGTEEQKAAVLADAINSKVGNMNQLLAQTPTGQMKQLQNELGDFQEELGATWQPLISSFLPIMRGSLEMLAEPVKNVSRGITTIGQAIASVDSPAVRAIALAAAGIAVMNKLKFAVGGTTAGIILAGVLLAGLVGSMQEEQESIGDIVSGAYNAAADATNQATDAASDYKDELGEVQKAAARLAGFDTITKLSGGTQGSLAAALIGDGDLSAISDAAEEAANAANSALAEIKMPTIDFREVGAKIFDFTSGAYNEFYKFGQNLSLLISGWGKDETMYQPLKNMTGQIEDFLNGVGLDGTGFVNFWKGVGADVHEAMTGGDSEILKGFQELDDAFRYMLGDFGKEWSDFWQSAGAGLYEMVHGAEINVDDLVGKYSLGDINSLIVEELKKGLSTDEAISSAKMQYLTSSEAVYWYENLIKPEDRSYYTVENWRNNLLESGKIQPETPAIEPYQTDRYDVPTRPSGVPSNVPSDQIAPVIHVYINDEETKAEAITVNNGK